MKTIRNEVFETNSSSTHSITIRRKVDLIRNKILIEDDILYPSRLKSYFEDKSDRYSETICDTQDKKLALVAQWIHGICGHDYSDKSKTVFDLGMAILKYEFKLKDIIFDNPNTYYSCYDEDKGEFLHTNAEFTNDLNNLIISIKDNNIEIIDSTTDW